MKKNNPLKNKRALSYFSINLSLILLFASFYCPSNADESEKSKSEISYNLPIKVLEEEINLPLMDFEKIKELISSYNLIPNRKIATTLVFIGYEQIEQKNPVQALKAFQTAAFIDETYFPAYLGEAEALLNKNIFNMLYLVPYKLVIGLFHCFGDFWQLSFFLGESILLLLIVILLSFAIFIMVLFLKKEVLLRHDIQELFRLKLGSYIPMIIMWIIIFIIFFVGGFFWLLLLTGITLFVYFNRSEKIIFISFLIICCLSSWMMLGTSVYLSSFESGFLRVAVDYLNGNVVHGNIEELTKYLDNNPEDFMAKFLLASMKSKYGIYNLDPKMIYSALDDYKELKQLKPEMSKLYNNTGNLYFTLSNIKKAISDYQKAIELDPNNFAANFNMNLALKKNLDFEEANKFLEKAKNLNKQKALYNTSLKIPNQNESIRLIPQELSFNELWDKVKNTREMEIWNFMGKLWSNMIKGVKGESVPVFFIIIIVVNYLVYFIRKKFDIPRNCTSCGVTLCKRCVTGKESKNLCLQCTQLSSKGSSISPDLRLAKIAIIKKYEKVENLKIKIFSFMIPGCGHLYAENKHQGILFLVFWLFISSIIIMGMDILSYPWNIHQSKILWVLYIPFVAVAISFYFYVNFFNIKELSIKES